MMRGFVTHVWIRFPVAPGPPSKFYYIRSVKCLTVSGTRTGSGHLSSSFFPPLFKILVFSNWFLLRSSLCPWYPVIWLWCTWIFSLNQVKNEIKFVFSRNFQQKGESVKLEWNIYVFLMTVLNGYSALFQLSTDKNNHPQRSQHQNSVLFIN